MFDEAATEVAHGPAAAGAHRGRGIAGLALARALRQREVAVEVVERRVAWTPEGAGLYILANGVRALRDLGLADELVARGAVNTRRRYATARGVTSFEVDLVEFWRDTGPCLGVARADLHDVLVTGVPGLAARMARTVDLIKEDAAGVTVAFSDGSQDRYDLAVGGGAARPPRTAPTACGRRSARCCSAIRRSGRPCRR